MTNGVAIYICHTTGNDIVKIDRFENKIDDKLLLNYFSKKKLAGISGKTNLAHREWGLGVGGCCRDEDRR